jgi:thiol-disulfide isomerase/thioredoxin
MAAHRCVPLFALLATALAAPPDLLAAPARKGPEVVAADIKEVMSAVRRPGAKAVLVNVWATWCEPCVAEMPDILKFYKERRDRGLRLILVSGDPSSEKKQVSSFLGGLGVDFRSYLKRGDDMVFIDGLDPGWDGTLPASLLFDGSGQKKRLWSGPVSYDALKKEVDPILETLSGSPEPAKPSHPNDGQNKRRTP